MKMRLVNTDIRVPGDRQFVYTLKFGAGAPHLYKHRRIKPSVHGSESG